MDRNRIYVSASLSCADLLHLQDAVQGISSSGADFIHYDVVDGEFNRCFVFGDLVLEKIRPLTSLPVEVHLAVQDVAKYIEPFARAGADYIAVHYETPCDHRAIFRQIRACGAKPVLAFRADTEVPADFTELAAEAAWILKLMVNPGFAGQKMQMRSLAHLRTMRRLLDQANLSAGIQADGNINAETIPLVTAAGANILTGGSSGLFYSDRLADNCRQMRAAAVSYQAADRT